MSARAADPRNEIAGPNGRIFALYVAAICVAGGGMLVGVLLGSDLGALRQLEPACWVAAGLLMVSEIRPLFLPGARDVNGVVLSTAFVFAMLLRYDLTVALLLQTIAVV